MSMIYSNTQQFSHTPNTLDPIIFARLACTGLNGSLIGRSKLTAEYGVCADVAEIE